MNSNRCEPLSLTKTNVTDSEEKKPFSEKVKSEIDNDQRISIFLDISIKAKRIAAKLRQIKLQRLSEIIL